MPAAAAGATGSPAAQSDLSVPAGITHCDTEATVVVPCAMPMPLTAIADRRKASRRFMIGPPSITMIRL